MTRAKILFVDDEPLVLRSLARALRTELHRWDAVTACGGQAAIVELERDSFAAVVSDLRMPVVDGLAVLSFAKRVAPGTVRIMLSGSADAEDLTTADIVDQLLCKPCDIATLRSTLDRLITAREPAGAPALVLVDADDGKRGSG